MKIESLEVTDYPPIKNLKLDNLGSSVIIAGANGSGKTRLKNAIMESLRGNPQLNLKLIATREEEETSFGGKVLDIKKGVRNNVLKNYINSRSDSGKYTGSIVQIDSQRNISNISYNPVERVVTDPDEAETPNTFYINTFTERWRTFITYIHKKVAAHERTIAREVNMNGNLLGKEILKKHPHPFKKYQNLFKQLLPGKELQEIDPASPKEFLYKDSPDKILHFSSLSSGEQEIIKIAFDLARKDIRHSIIIVDEPDLHLHPTLTFKLIETLKTIGDHTNQFIFLTHSADLISTYYSTGDVYFIDAVQTGTNQAHCLRDLDRTHSELVKLVGRNLGIFAVGKKLIFVEGEMSSIDRLTYQSIANEHLPDARVIPVGTVKNLITLNAVNEQIRDSIFGINIYMIRDRDGLTQDSITKIEQSGRIKCLKRSQIENYFFDSDVLLQVAKKFCVTATNPLVTVEFIEAEMKKIAEQMLNYNLVQNMKDYLTSKFFEVPKIDTSGYKDTNRLKSDMIQRIEGSLVDLSLQLERNNLEQKFEDEEKRLKKLLEGNGWKHEFRGKPIFSILCSRVFNCDQIRVRQAYTDIALRDKPDVFADIIAILGLFK